MFLLLLQFQTFTPAYHEVAYLLGLLAQGMVTVAAIDCDEEANKKLCSKYGVKGFPTIKVNATPA